MKTLLTIAFVLPSLFLWAQSEKKSVVIGSMTSKPNALLIVNPELGDQGVLLPQLSTSQRMAMQPTSPAEDGLMVFDTTAQAYYYWSGNAWIRLQKERALTTSFLSIDPALFQELKPTGDIRHDNIGIFEADNTFITATHDVNEQMIAPVQLPHGAVMQELRVHYMNNSSSSVRLHLIRKAWNGPSQQILSWESSAPAATATSEAVVNFNGMEVIDLENYSYRLVFQFNVGDDNVDSPDEAEQRLYGIRIKYQQ